MVDEPTRLSILPEQWAGWLGRPGLSGSRADGSAWSPKFVTHTLLIDGEPTTASGDAPAFAELGAGTVEVLAADAEAGLELSLGLELTVGGLLRSQARLTNSGQDGYRLDDLIHSPVRLSVMSALRHADAVHFGLLRDTVEVSDSLLSKHLAALEAEAAISRHYAYLSVIRREIRAVVQALATQEAQP